MTTTYVGMQIYGGLSSLNEKKSQVLIWITAHNDDKCCGHEHRTLIICFDGTGDQFDESVC